MKFMSLLTAVAGAALVSGCASSFVSQVSPAPGAPVFPPTESAALAHEPPPGAVLLAKIDEKGTNKDRTGDDCLRMLQVDAGKLGATHMVPKTEVQAKDGNPPSCSGEAYHLHTGD